MPCKNKLRQGLLLLLCFLFLLSGCVSKQAEEPTTTPSVPQTENGEVDEALKIRLPYFKKDSLNPYAAVSAENRALASLFAEPLFRVQKEYTPAPILAETVENQGKSVKVTLQTAKFSDGKTLSAQDVVYAFQKAKASEWYASRLATVESAKALSSKKVEFTLTEPNRFAENLLTFPIVKQNSAESADSVPVGTGAYVLSVRGEVEKNKQNPTSNAAPYVALEGIQDLTHLKNTLEIGNIHFLFSDFQNGTYERVVAQNTFLTMNNLVYLGMNHTAAPLHVSAFRTALYYAVDKDGIASSAYQGCAKPAAVPLHPDAAETLSLLLPKTAGDTQKAMEILRKIGYNRYDKEGHLTNGTAAPKLSVLVNNNNPFRVAAAEHISRALLEIGIAAPVESVPYETYMARLQSGAYTLYIGEVKLPEDLSLSTFFDGGAADRFMLPDLSSRAAALAWHRGEISTEAFKDSFLDDMPFIPLCYRAGMAAYSKEIEPSFQSAAYDIYGNLPKWQKKV